MASGDRKIKLQELMIPRPPAGGNVVAEIKWKLFVENKVALDNEVQGGTLSLSLGTWPVAKLKTLETIMTDSIDAINTDGTMPAHDSAN